VKLFNNDNDARLTAIFQDNRGNPAPGWLRSGFIGAKDEGGGGKN